MADALDWFEIPALDADRARGFYETILDTKMQDLPTDEPGYKMYAFHWSETEVGGSVVEGEGYVPSDVGSLVYLNAGDSLASCVNRVEKAGGKVIQASIPIGENGFIAMITDTEGNKVGLHSMKQ